LHSCDSIKHGVIVNTAEDKVTKKILSKERHRAEMHNKLEAIGDGKPPPRQLIALFREWKQIFLSKIQQTDNTMC